MSLLVYGFPHSPFCIAVEMALRACDTPFTSEFVPSWDRSELLRVTNGQSYEVPLLAHDGRLVCESSADSQDVARYIDAEFAGHQLFPSHLKGRHEIVLRYLEHEVEDVTFRLFDPFYVDSISDVAQRGMLVRHKERKFGRGCVERWRNDRESLIQEAERLLEPLDAMLHCDAFLFGPAPVYADYLLAGILGNITFRGFNKIPKRLERLPEFQSRMEAFRYAPQSRENAR